MMSSEPTPLFQLLSTPLAKEQVRYLRDVAELTRLRELLYKTLKSVEYRLQVSPRDWGDPFHNLTGMKMVAYQRLFEHLVIVYAVHEEDSLVWIQSIKPGLGHLLVGDPNFPSV